MRIAQLANLVTPTSGGIRTTLDALGRGYSAAGHDRHLVIPGTGRARHRDRIGTTWILPGVPLPGGGDYQLLARRGPVVRLLERIRPDVVELSDRWTLTWAADWARTHDVPVVVLVHEHLADTLQHALRLPPVVARRLARRRDRRIADVADRVVCASTYSAGPFGGVATVIPLGVDLVTFHPDAARDRVADGNVRLVLVSRLSREKRPDLALAAVRLLAVRGAAVRLDVFGHGPERPRLVRAAREVSHGLPPDRVIVRLHGHVAGRGVLAHALAAADVALVPCPIESFGLAAVEALACGTPVVATGGGVEDLDLAARGAGATAAPRPGAIATAVEDVLRLPRRHREASARRIAAGLPWSRTVSSMLQVHHDVRSVVRSVARRPVAA